MKKAQDTVTENLIRIKRAQDVDSVEALYTCFSATVRHIGLKYLCDRHMADDFVQEFWADIDRIANGFTVFSNGRAYLCRVAKKRAINYLKHRGIRETYVTYVDYSTLEIADADEDPSRVALRLSVEQAMRALDERERVIIQATFFEQKTVREIAKEMRISKSQVERVKQSALEKLKKTLL